MTSILEVEQLDTLSSNASSTLTIGGTNTSNVTFKSGVNFSGITQGITEADQWRLTADLTTNVDPISSNLERVNNTGFGYIGSGMSVSSGTWTFPSTGIYKVSAIARGYLTGSDTANLKINVTTDNSSYSTVAQCAIGEAGNSRTQGSITSFFVDVTDTANVKVRFSTSSVTSAVFEGSTGDTRTFFEFIRLGDT